jgi:alpha-1,3-glucan synthase
VEADFFTSRLAMPSNKAWQRHGCYHLGSDSLYDLEISRSTVGCLDDWNSLDRFDPSADVCRLFKQLFDLCATYPVLNDGLSLVQNWNLTYQYVLPFWNGSPTEPGL